VENILTHERKSTRRVEKRGASQIVLCSKYYEGDQIKENEMGGTCSKEGGREMYTKF
jgi:hypothetical protein